jgi:hypothetical protein
MQEINRYELDFQPTHKYIISSLKGIHGINALSAQLLSLISFDKGKFFAFLPENMDLHKIKDFQSGWREGIGVRSYIESYILDKLKKNSQLTAVFDDVSLTFLPGYEEEVFAACGVAFEKEIYYLLPSKIASPQLIEDCFYCSDALWHSLCVLTTSDLSQKDSKTLSLEEIKAICLQTVLIVVGAYDGQSYVMWAKNDCRIDF